MNKCRCGFSACCSTRTSCPCTSSSRTIPTTTTLCWSTWPGESCSTGSSKRCTLQHHGGILKNERGLFALYRVQTNDRRVDLRYDTSCTATCDHDGPARKDGDDDGSRAIKVSSVQRGYKAVSCHGYRHLFAHAHAAAAAAVQHTLFVHIEGVSSLLP